MHLIITDAWLAKAKPLHLTGVHLTLAILSLAIVVMLTSVGLYHWVFLKGAQEGWPVIGAFVRIVMRDEMAQRDRHLQANIDAMARQVGELQAKLIQLESLGDRVSSLSGVPLSLNSHMIQGRGGVLKEDVAIPATELQSFVDRLGASIAREHQRLIELEGQLFDQRLQRAVMPTQSPVSNVQPGSLFGWRIDPISGRSALHTGIDFAGIPGTPIHAAAGGVVTVQEYHAQYGNLIEIDHGNGLSSLYAHTSRVFVHRGDLVKRGQKIGEIGSSGRSTGPHLHFEVLVDGVPQDPMRFLAGNSKPLDQARNGVIER
jgi:murein DD-endopeptidase MepM/ murein hydrolase activator NlpD